MTGVLQTIVPFPPELAVIVQVGRLNFAVALEAATGVKVHCGFVEPAQGPAVQPAKSSPESGTAVSVIGHPVAKCAVCVVHPVPHESHAGALESSAVPLLAASLLLVTLTCTPKWSV